MFTNVTDAIEWITSCRNENYGFNHFKEVMDILQNPQDKLKIIHVAGTNGKGSVTNYIKDILCANGYKVGTFQSPHIITHLDRIRINSINIDEEAFLAIVNNYYDFFIEQHLNMFEMDYIIMVDYFLSNNVDFVVCEVGLGGRLDATNVVSKPLLSIIVTIGLDHQERLGHTIEQIAIEKAGIIKNNCPVLIGDLPPEAKKEIIYKTLKTNSVLYNLNKYQKISNGHFEYRNDIYRIISNANYQIHNSALAIEAIYILNDTYNLGVTSKAIKDGLKVSKYQGRFELISINPNIIIDGAHNIDGIKALIDSCTNLNRPLICITSILKDKNYLEMLKLLHDFFDEVIVTTFDFYRANNLNDLKVYDSFKAFDNYQESLTYAKELVHNGNIVVCGSLYFISSIIEDTK